MQFKDIHGHTSAKQMLLSMANRGRIPHALLIHGPQGIGKMLLARAFAQYICCEHPVNGDSCGTCPSCLQTAALNNPDIHYIFPFARRKSDKKESCGDFSEEWREMLTKYPYMQPEKWIETSNAGNSQPVIYVTESEDITRVASMSALQADYKIFVIWQPEKLNADAANKLLKVIEEPFEDTIFLLVSNRPDLILPTIFSRCQRIATRRLSDAEMLEWLAARGLTGSEAITIARIAEGSPAQAELLTDAAGESNEFGEYFRAAMRNAYAAKVDALKSAADKFAGLGREKAMRLCDYFSRQVRENFIRNLQTPELNVMTDDEAAFSSRFAPFIHSGNVERILSDIDRVRVDISRNANGKIVWFDFLLHLMLLIRMKEG